MGTAHDAGQQLVDLGFSIAVIEPDGLIILRRSGPSGGFIDHNHTQLYALFSYVQNSVYWSDTRFASGPSDARYYITSGGSDGSQNVVGKADDLLYALAVSPD